jgi:peptidoglycan-associated lipoprotein
MKTKLLLAAGVLAILTGCGQQPELDVNADQNNTKPAVEQNVTKADANITQAQPTETDLTDNATVEVTQDSMNENPNQQLAQALSKEVVHFDFDKYNIRNDQMPIVEQVANLLKDSKGNYTIRIEGNCDEWGTDEYNYALGLKRAKTVKQALIDLGVDANKLTIISYGESNPVCTAHTKECWAKNRRDNFTLLP